MAIGVENAVAPQSVGLMHLEIKTNRCHRADIIRTRLYASTEACPSRLRRQHCNEKISKTLGAPICPPGYAQTKA
jgi:hypothetical protein